MNNISLSHFKAGTEISEARKHIGSIYQYLSEPHIQDELFVEAIEKINKKRTEESDLITDDEEKKGLQSFLESGKILLEDKSFRLEILGKFKPIIQDLLGKVNEMLSTHPVKVNMAHILIVEGWFWISNINNKPNNDSIKFIDGRLVIPERKVDPIEELMGKRMALLKPDLMRRLASFKSQADNLSFDTEGGEEIAKELLNGNLLSTDPMFGMYFAFTLSQCSVYDIKDFLSYQKSEYNGDFNDFLELTLLKYKQLLTEEQIIVISNWMNKNESKPTTMDKDDEFNDYYHISGLLSETEIETFFSFLYKENNGEKKPFLPKDDVIELLKNGFTLSNSPNRRFKLALEGDKSLGIIYYSIHCFYLAHGTSRKTKKLIAQFFYDNFKDFSKISFKNFMNAINPNKPKTMIFDLYKSAYLPDL